MPGDYMDKIQSRAVPMLTRAKMLVKDRVFLGPGKVKLNPTEALNRIQQMTPEERAEMIQSVGNDEFMSQLERLLEGASKK